jgi:hypothetical protein
VIERWHAFLEGGHDPAALDELLADDAVFCSTAVFTQQEGKAKAAMYLRTAEKLFAGTDFQFLVPGSGQDLAAFQGANNKSMSMYNAAIQADQTLNGHLAVTTWMGYDRPDPARNGAGALDSYLSGVQASHQGPASIDTVVGHSYGSTLVGAAASGGHHLPVENIIGVGSPGMLVSNASDLSLDPGGQVYAARAENDIIKAAVGTVLGPDPTWNGFGAVDIQASPGPTWGPPALEIPSVDAHSSYWDNGNPALADMGAIIAGKPPPFIVPPN